MLRFLFLSNLLISTHLAARLSLVPADQTVPLALSKIPVSLLYNSTMSIFAKAAVAALAIRDGPPAGPPAGIPAAIAAMNAGAPSAPPAFPPPVPSASSSGQYSTVHRTRSNAHIS